jgi:hypothetical protein
VRAKLDPGGVFSNPQKLYVPDARSGVAAGGGTIAA